jgi:hypothetical protein
VGAFSLFLRSGTLLRSMALLELEAVLGFYVAWFFKSATLTQSWLNPAIKPQNPRAPIMPRVGDKVTVINRKWCSYSCTFARSRNLPLGHLLQIGEILALDRSLDASSYRSSQV